MGEGRPVVLLHGLFSNAEVNWIRFGHAEAIAARGFRLILPDLRAHGASAKPHDTASYPPDVLARDGLALVEHLSLERYDLGGYSLGARTALRMVVLGAAPERLVVAGMGLQGIVEAEARSVHFRNILTNLGSFERGTAQWFAEAFLKTNDGDPEALLPLLDSFVDTREEELTAVSMPTLVLSGAEDKDNGSAEQLARALPKGRFVEVAGNHMSVVTERAFGQAIADFLDLDPGAA